MMAAAVLRLSTPLPGKWRRRRTAKSMFTCKCSRAAGQDSVRPLSKPAAAPSNRDRRHRRAAKHSLRSRPRRAPPRLRSPSPDPSPNPNLRPSPNRRIPTAATPARAPPAPTAAAPSRPAPAAMPSASPTAAMPAAAVKAAAAKATAMKLQPEPACRGDRRRHAERGYGRNHGLLDRNTHGNIPPADRPRIRRVSILKLCRDGKRSRGSSRPPAKN